MNKNKCLRILIPKFPFISTYEHWIFKDGRDKTIKDEARQLEH